MTRKVRLTTRAERNAYRAIKRLCGSGLDSVTLRQEVAREAAAVVPTEARSLVATDPDTGLFAHGMIDSIPDELLESYLKEFYPVEFGEYIELARTKVASGANSGAFLSALRTSGLEYRARTALCAEGDMWGSWCMFRDQGAPEFSDRELDFMRAVAPHVGSGLRDAALIEAGRKAGEAEPEEPGILVLDASRRVVLRSGPAGCQLDDIATIGSDPDILPFAVASVLGRLHSDEGAAGAPVLRVQGRTGQWYRIRGLLAEPDQAGGERTVVIIEPITSHPRASTVSRRYGLTPRESEVLRLALRGKSVKRIGAALGVSPYTVQDHLDNIGEKMGVRGRKALLAKLARDAAASMLEPDGSSAAT